MGLTAGFGLLAAGAPVVCRRLLIEPARPSWALAGLAGLCAAAGYVLTRSLAMPGDGDDGGNGLEPFGLAALIIELVIVILAVLAIASQRRTADGGRPRPGTAQYAKCPGQRLGGPCPRLCIRVAAGGPARPRRGRRPTEPGRSGGPGQPRSARR